MSVKFSKVGSIIKTVWDVLFPNKTGYWFIILAIFIALPIHLTFYFNVVEGSLYKYGNTVTDENCCTYPWYDAIKFMGAYAGCIMGCVFLLMLFIMFLKGNWISDFLKDDIKPQVLIAVICCFMCAVIGSAGWLGWEWNDCKQIEAEERCFKSETDLRINRGMMWSTLIFTIICCSYIMARSVNWFQRYRSEAIKTAEALKAEANALVQAPKIQIYDPSNLESNAIFKKLEEHRQL